MKISALLAVLAMLSGCTGMQAIPPAPFQSPPASSSTESKNQIYLSHYVNEHAGIASKVGQTWYSPQAMLSYYQSSKAAQAASLQSEAVSQYVQAERFYGASALIGGLSGASTALVYVATNSSFSDADKQWAYFLLGMLGLAGGQSIGTIVGWIGQKVHNDKAFAKNEEAGKSFNYFLFNQLKLDVLPEPGGAKAGASVRF